MKSGAIADDRSEIAQTIENILADDSARDNPHGLFAAVRNECPLYKTADGAWVVLGLKATNALLRDRRVSRWEAARHELGLDESTDPVLKEALSANLTMMIARDNPDHTRLRQLLRHAFLPSAIEGWRRRIEGISKLLVDQVEGKQEFDFVKEVAFPLPEMVICEMLGVPHSDHALWSEWSHILATSNRTPKPTGESLLHIQQATLNFHNYFKELIKERRQNLGEDLLSTLLRAEEAGDKLTESEVIGNITALIQAGHETTASLVANGMLILLDNPELYAQLRASPDNISRAVEEFLRIDGPAQFSMPRKAIEDIEIEGVTIRANDAIIFVLMAANRDPAMFQDPDRVDINRPNLAYHLAFGSGAHICIGRQLAVLESRIMFHEVITRMPDLQLCERPRYARMFTRGMESLKVKRAARSEAAERTVDRAGG